MQDLQAKQAEQEQLIQGLHTDVARCAQHCMTIRSDPSSVLLYACPFACSSLLNVTSWTGHWHTLRAIALLCLEGTKAQYRL